MEEELLTIWQEIITEAKKTKEYNKDIKYGTYQIDKDLNLFHYVDEKAKKNKAYEYPMLNTKINALKILLKDYYNRYIQDKLFEYELLK